MTSPLHDAESATAGVPVVRGLVWTKHPTNDIWRVDTLLGAYKVYGIMMPASWVFDGNDGTVLEANADNPDASKAACQADFEQRCLAIINPDFLSELDTARAEIGRLRHDNEMLTTGGIAEVAVRNPSVMDYMRHWEGRAETAESALTAAQARIAELEGALAKANRTATDRLYMMNAYRQMLGPNGRQVAAIWDAKGVLRQHTDWGPSAHLLTGEERAQCHLDTEEAMKTARKMEPGEIDGATLSAVKENDRAGA